MEYYEQIINHPGCVCRPLLPADQADEEIARLRSVVNALKAAIADKDQLINDAVKRIAELERDIHYICFAFHNLRMSWNKEEL